MVALNFNARNVKPNTALEPVPTGLYPVVIVRSDEKPNSKGTGTYVEIEMQIQNSPHIPPEFHGRKVYDRLNLNNPNQQAVDIAYATLSAICHVTGVLDMVDTQQLHNRPFVAVVRKVPRSDKPDIPTNEVAGYKDINGNDPGFGGNVAQQSAQPQWAANPAQPQQQAPAPAQTAPQAPAPNSGAAPSWAQTTASAAPAQQAPQQQAPAPAQSPAVPSWAQPKVA